MCEQIAESGAANSKDLTRKGMAAGLATAFGLAIGISVVAYAKSSDVCRLSRVGVAGAAAN
jgi:hypothetical protein